MVAGIPAGLSAVPDPHQKRVKRWVCRTSDVFRQQKDARSCRASRRREMVGRARGAHRPGRVLRTENDLRRFSRIRPARHPRAESIRPVWDLRRSGHAVVPSSPQLIQPADHHATTTPPDLIMNRGGKSPRPAHMRFTPLNRMLPPDTAGTGGDSPYLLPDRHSSRRALVWRRLPPRPA